jgi:hypothetical protein
MCMRVDTTTCMCMRECTMNVFAMWADVAHICARVRLRGLGVALIIINTHHNLSQVLLELTSITSRFASSMRPRCDKHTLLL